MAAWASVGTATMSHTIEETHMIYAKALREKLAKLSIDMRAIVDKAKADNNRGLTSEEATNFDALEADYSATEASIARAEKADKIENDLRIVDKDQILALGAIGDHKGAADPNANLHEKPFTKDRKT